MKHITTDLQFPPHDLQFLAVILRHVFLPSLENMFAEHFIDVKDAIPLGLYGRLIDLLEASAVEDLKFPSF